MVSQSKLSDLRYHVIKDLGAAVVPGAQRRKHQDCKGELRMARCVFLIVLTLALVAVTPVGITACGPGAAPTTTSAETATTADVTTADTATQDEYNTQMSAWVMGPLQKLDTSVFDIPDPANATTQQIDAVAGFVGQAQAVLEQLKAIKPSAEAKIAHDQFVKAYDDLLAATERYVSALRSRDASALAGIEQAMSTAQGQMQQSKAILGPMIGLTPPTT
jgi:hypothetical protein